MMINIQLKNEIKQGNEVEIIESNYQGDLFQKKDYFFINYKDSDDNKTIIKFNSTTLEIIRFGKHQSKLFLTLDQQGYAHFVYPEMAFDLITNTESLTITDNQIAANYQLIQPIDNSILADYQLSVSYNQ